MAKHIQLELDPAGNLKDPGTVTRGNFLGRRVIWQIKRGENIESFRLEGKGTSTYYPFEEDLNPGHGTELELKVEEWFRPGVWEYKIIWKKIGDDHEYILDPKIAVNPLAPLTEVVGILVIAITGLLGMRIYQKKRIRNRRL